MTPTTGTIDYEELTLKVLLAYPEMAMATRLKLPPSYVGNEALRSIYNEIIEYTRLAHGTPPTLPILAARLTKLRPEQPDYYTGVVDRLAATKPDASERGHLSFYIEKVKEAFMGRSLRDVMGHALDKLEKGDVFGAEQSLYANRPTLSDKFFQGDLMNDLEQHTAEMDERLRHPELYAGIPIGFAPIDSQSGGHYRKELAVMIGGTGVGKSAFLGQVAINVAKQGKRVLLITIENDQTAYMNRLYSNISGVPYRAFKEALSSPEDRGRWLESMADLPEKFHLKLAWFPEGCNASEILFLLQMMPEEIEYLVIDQITNMNPVNPDQYKPDSWQAMGRIALELKRLGDIAYGKGLPILTASQASGGVTEKKELSTDDVAMSKQILRHAHIGFYITRVEDVYQAGASKYRDTRIEPFPVFPDFKCWRIADRPADGGRSVPQPAPMAAVPSAIPPPRIDTPREQEAAMEELVEAEKAELEPDPTPVFGASVPLAPPAPEPAPEALKDSGTTSKPIDEAF